MAESNTVQFDTTKYKLVRLDCVECGHNFPILVPLNSSVKISPILTKQYESGLCDKCFTKWAERGAI